MTSKILLLISILLLINSNLYAQQERYIDEIFGEVNIETGIEYAINWDIITGTPALDTLIFDLYTPEGDDSIDRPVVILWTGGKFLPNSINGLTLGTQTDYANVEIAHRLAKRGYVVVIPSYRKGWNPVSPDIHTRGSTFLNAVYRGVQDSRAMVRYLRKSIDEEGNPFGICESRIVQWGVGSGGFIAANSTTLDTFDDLLLDKFTRPIMDGPPEYYLNLSINSDPSGSTETILNHVNHPGFEDEVSLCVNMGGALADSSFLDASDPPMICFATPGDSEVPYNTRLILSLEDIFIFETTGSYDIINRAQELGINDVFSGISGDAFSEAAAFTASHPNAPEMPISNPEGLNGLMPFNRPYWENPFNGLLTPENAPWDYWDAEYWSTIEHFSCPFGVPLDECNSHIVNSVDNQDMSFEKANLYLDSIMGYVLPRAYLALNLSQEFACTTQTEDLFEQKNISFEIFPNPVSSSLNLNSDLIILKASIYNLRGDELVSFDELNALELSLDRKGIESGLYFIEIKTAEGTAVKKVVFN